MTELKTFKTWREIRDAIRFAKSEKERHKIAQEIDDATKENYGLWK